MPLVTVSRQYGAGGSALARGVAERLEWTLIDNAFVERVAERVGLPPDEVARREERLPSFAERLANALSASTPEVFLTTGEFPVAATGPSQTDLVRMTEAVIEEAVHQGNVVFVGRGAQACLSPRKDALHVRLVAPVAHRVAVVMDRLTLSPKEAEDRVAKVDAARAAYVNTHYGRDWNDAVNYDLVVNTGRVPLDRAVDLVVHLAERLPVG